MVYYISYHYMHAGTKVLFGVYALHRHAGVWGDDVEVHIIYMYNQVHTLGIMSDQSSK